MILCNGCANGGALQSGEKIVFKQAAELFQDIFTTDCKDLVRSKRAREQEGSCGQIKKKTARERAKTDLQLWGIKKAHAANAFCSRTRGR